jgi:hypothetical protein
MGFMEGICPPNERGDGYVVCVEEYPPELRDAPASGAAEGTAASSEITVPTGEGLAMCSEQEIILNGLSEEAARRTRNKEAK